MFLPRSHLSPISLSFLCLFLSPFSPPALTYSAPTLSSSQMIRKSVETRDWLKTIEPRNVRSVMKRIVEEVTLIDKRVGALYKEGSKKDQGSGWPEVALRWFSGMTLWCSVDSRGTGEQAHL